MRVFQTEDLGHAHKVGQGSGSHFFIIVPRWIFTVISLRSRSAATCLLRRPAQTRVIT